MSYTYGIETETEVLEAEFTTLFTERNFPELIEETSIDFEREENSFRDKLTLKNGMTLEYIVKIEEEGRVTIALCIQRYLYAESVELGLEEGRLNTYKGKNIIASHIIEKVKLTEKFIQSKRAREGK